MCGSADCLRPCNTFQPGGLSTEKALTVVGQSKEAGTGPKSTTYGPPPCRSKCWEEYAQWVGPARRIAPIRCQLLGREQALAEALWLSPIVRAVASSAAIATASAPLTTAVRDICSTSQCQIYRASSGHARRGPTHGPGCQVPCTRIVRVTSGVSWRQWRSWRIAVQQLQGLRTLANGSERLGTVPAVPGGQEVAGSSPASPTTASPNTASPTERLGPLALSILLTLRDYP